MVFEAVLGTVVGLGVINETSKTLKKKRKKLKL